MIIMGKRNKKKPRSNRFGKGLRVIALVGFLILNIIAYNQAYQFTHFSSLETTKTKVEELSFLQKMKLAFVGVRNPKPENTSFPDASFKTVYLQSHEKLEAWLINQDSAKNGVVILFHGYSGSKSGILNYSKEFGKLGFATFLVDFMGSGGSEGKQTTIGFKESRNVKEAFDYVKTQFPDSKIILFGSSMGAVSIMKAMADFDLKPGKLILECPFGEMRITVQKRFEIMQIPSFILADLLLFYGGLQNNFNPYEHNPTEYAKQIETETLLLYGAKDNRVSKAEIDEIYQNLEGKKLFHQFEKLGHENYLRNGKEEWLETVTEFLR